MELSSWPLPTFVRWGNSPGTLAFNRSARNEGFPILDCIEPINYLILASIVMQISCRVQGRSGLMNIAENCKNRDRNGGKVVKWRERGEGKCEG